MCQWYTWPILIMFSCLNLQGAYIYIDKSVRKTIILRLSPGDTSKIIFKQEERKLWTFVLVVSCEVSRKLYDFIKIIVLFHCHNKWWISNKKKHLRVRRVVGGSASSAIKQNPNKLKQKSIKHSGICSLQFLRLCFYSIASLIKHETQ